RPWGLPKKSRDFDGSYSEACARLKPVAATSASVQAFQNRAGEGCDVERLARRVFAAPHDDHLTAGHDHHILPTIAEGGEGVGGYALGSVHQPEGRAIAEVARRRLRPGRRRDVVAPALRQEALALPHPVLQIQLAEAGQIARRRPDL